MMNSDMKHDGRLHWARPQAVLAGLLLAGLALVLTGCGMASGPYQTAWSGGGALKPGMFQAADPPGIAPSSPVSPAAPAAPEGPAREQRKKEIADSEEAPGEPGALHYVLYGLVGSWRDAGAMVVEPPGYVVGVVGGLAFNIVMLPFSFGYSGEFRVERPVSRGCITAACLPVFIPSDILFRSFTGDMDRYRFGVHPFPRAKHRFFPNYHAILRPGESKEDE